MKYTELTLKVPEGYEDQVRDFAMRKIESIVSQLLLTVEQTKIADFNTTMVDICSQNKVEGVFKDKFVVK